MKKAGKENVLLDSSRAKSPEGRSVMASLARGMKVWMILMIFGFICRDVPISAKTVVDAAGREVTAPDAPQRIISMAPSVTEMLFALGLGSRVVGVSRFSDYPPEVQNLPKVGPYVDIHLEAVLGLNPDLAIGVEDGNPHHVTSKLRELHIPVYITNPRDFQGVLHSLESLGELLGAEERAAALVGDMKRRLECIRSLTSGLPRPKVLLQIEHTPLVTVNRDTLQSKLIELAGGDNPAQGEPVHYPRYSMETVLQSQPDVIIISTMLDQSSLQSEIDGWKRYSVLPAVRNGRIYAISPNIIARAGPRIIQGLEAMFKMIHPEVSLDCGKAS